MIKNIWTKIIKKVVAHKDESTKITSTGDNSKDSWRSLSIRIVEFTFFILIYITSAVVLLLLKICTVDNVIATTTSVILAYVSYKTLGKTSK